MKNIIKKAIYPSPKFRIVSRDKNFVPQEFIGIWKLGLYADISKEFNCSGWIPHHFEHENIAEAELVIERRQKQLKHKHYAAGTYDDA
ncbi:MAG: hypothetical protein JRF72_09870 [Deltaproteobacteria bacterium]|jgi:hypothetical protein|nr:hypothetical protein [Deltaproteobacteria bacterium]